MTDRDTFAAAALTGLIACMKDETCAEICESAYWWADSMLRERGVTEPLPKEKRAEVSYKLTDEEREAIEDAIVLVDYGGCRGNDPKATLRRLLERLA